MTRREENKIITDFAENQGFTRIYNKTFLNYTKQHTMLLSDENVIEYKDCFMFCEVNSYVGRNGIDVVFIVDNKKFFIMKGLTECESREVIKSLLKDFEDEIYYHLDMND